MDGNVCLNAGALGSLEDTRLIAGIWVCAVSDALIQRNEVGGTRLFENDGTAFDTDWGTQVIPFSSTIIRMITRAASGWTAWESIGTGNAGKTILRYNISIDDKRCLIQDDYGLPAHLYGNLFINSEEGPLICCHKEGESHIFRNNIFHFVGKPANGWQKSSFQRNWYSGNTGFPESDRGSVGDVPFCLSGLLDNKPVSGKNAKSLEPSRGSWG